MAGTGKSTIARTVARGLNQRGTLGASFFFKRGEGDHGNASRFFTTITAQLARKLPSLAQHVQEVIEADSDVGKSFIDVQFKKLVFQPLKKVDSDPESPLTTIVVVIDALDECDTESDATKIISLLPQVKQLSSVRLKFFVTSRPEFPIRLQFSEIRGTYQDLVLHQVDKDIIGRDIGTFLESELSQFRVKYNNHFPRDRQLSSDWPGPTNIQLLVDMAIPLFIFAATISRFLGDWRGGRHPDKKLSDIIKYQTRSQTSKLDATYAPVLDQLLINLSRPEREDRAKHFREVVGPIVVLAKPLSTISLSHLLGIPKQDIDCELDLLHSVLDIPYNAETPIKLFHLSFRDFLVDPEKRDTNPFWVDEMKTHETITSKCLGLLSKYLKNDICGLLMPGATRTDIDKQRILDCLPLSVQYACLYWVHHLKGSRRRIQDEDQAHSFLKRYFLYWLEALSLVGRLSESISMITDLLAIVDVSKSVISSVTIY
jgi:NACHT domain